MQIVADAAAGYAASGYFTVVDGIVIPSWFLEPLREALSGAGHSVAYAVLRAPLSVCMSRAESRERLPLSDHNVIEQLWRSFADLGGLEQNVIDLDDRTPDEVADALALQLASGRLAV
jgi:hypothetical protein